MPASSLSLNLLCAGIGCIAGWTVGTCVAAVWVMLKLPIRAMQIFHVEKTAPCGWALWLGAVGGTLLDLLQARLWLGMLAGMLTLGMGGMFVGMLSAGLAEVLDVIPQMAERTRLTQQMTALAWAMSIGKILGAFFTTLWKLW